MPDQDRFSSEAARGFINEQVPFAHHCGVAVLRLDEAGGEALLPEAPQLTNHVGTQHAGALFTVAETASGACMLGLVGARFSTVVPLARNASIAFRRPARGAIRAVATSDTTRSEVHQALEEAGRCSFTVGVELLDAVDTVVATAEIEWHLRNT